MNSVEAANALREQRRARRARWRWLPTALIALACVAAVIGAVAMGRSWWAEPRPAASADQVAGDGTSVFTQAGRDFFTREGDVRVKLGAAALPAGELGLPADGETELDFAVPLEVRLLAPDGVAVMPLMGGMTITTSGDELVAVELRPGAGSGFQGQVMPTLHALAPKAGWSEADFAAFTEELGSAGQASDDGSYAAVIGPGDGLGVDASARVDVAPGAVEVVVRFER